MGEDWADVEPAFFEEALAAPLFASPSALANVSVSYFDSFCAVFKLVRGTGFVVQFDMAKGI